MKCKFFRRESVHLDTLPLLTGNSAHSTTLAHSAAGPPAQLKEVQPKPGLPGRDGPFCALGATVSHSDFETTLNDYYRIRGWDPASGLLTREGLAALELEDLTAELYERSLLAE